MAKEFNPLEQRIAKGLTRERTAQLLSEKYEQRHPDKKNHYSSDMILRMEKDPYGMTREDELIWNSVFQSTDKIVIPTVKNCYGPMNDLRRDIIKLAEELSDESLKAELIKYSKYLCRKLKVKLIGPPDSGKTTLISNLIGDEGKKLPTGWTPETCNICVFKSISDRPEWAGTHKVIVINEPKDYDYSGNQISPKTVDDYLDLCSANENFRKQCVVNMGDMDMLALYASHSTREERGIDDIYDADAIIIYADAPILNNNDIYDLPGYNPNGTSQLGDNAEYDSNDSRLSAYEMQSADVLIMLCPATSFMYGDNAEMAFSVITSIPSLPENRPLSNLYFVASHNESIKSDEDREKILNGAAKRLWNRVENNPAIKESRCTEEDLRARFFTSEMNSERLSHAFIKDLCELLEALPKIQLRRCQELLSEFFTSEASAAKIELEKIKSESYSSLRFTEEMLNAGKDNILKDSEEVLKHTEEFRKKSLEEMKRIYCSVISNENIKSIIEERKYHKNKRDLESLLSDLNAELNNRMTDMLNNYSKKLSSEVGKFTSKVDADFSNPKFGNSAFSFNAGRAFAGGVAGAATFGALAAWAATCGNLGGYIIVAQVVGLLASAGIHVGGAAAAISAVASIGGPVTIGIALAVVAGLTLFLALGGTWKRVIGNKIVKQYEKSNALGQLNDCVNKYWNDTSEAFKKGRDNMIRELEKSFAWSKAMLENKSGEREMRIKVLEETIVKISSAAANLINGK